MSAPTEERGAPNMNTSMNIRKSMKQTDLNRKFRVLSMIKENKTMLFGTVSDKLSKDTRTEQWKQIFAFACTLNVVPHNKDYIYVRDVFWQNCKKYAIAKLENYKKGRLQCKLNACDQVALDIIGRGSEIDGLTTDEPITCSQVDFGASCSVSSTNNVTSQPIQDRKRAEAEEEPPSLAVKKQKLVIEHLELLNHKTKLEIALMEKKLGYSPSIFTKDLNEKLPDSIDANAKGADVVGKCQYEEEENVDIEGSKFIEDDELCEKDNKFIIKFV